MMLLPLFLLLLPPAPSATAFPWPHAADSQSLAERMELPAGFVRVELEPGSFGEYLRALPVKRGRPPVRLFNGTLKNRQDVHAAVLDIDTGARNLQQCADAVIRLRAEYLWASGRKGDLLFHFTSGDEASWAKWADGYRPVVNGSAVRWSRSAASEVSYAAFRAYLNKVFEFAGTRSVFKELEPVRRGEVPRPGEVLIQAGSPGHTVIVIDAAAGPGGRERLYLLAQSYMPAQEIHVLNNLAEPALGPWFRLPDSGSIETPEWTFQRDDLRRFPD